MHCAAHCCSQYRTVQVSGDSEKGFPLCMCETEGVGHFLEYLRNISKGERFPLSFLVKFRHAVFNET